MSFCVTGSPWYSRMIVAIVAKWRCPILPMPDVTAASAGYEAGAAVLVVKATSAGPEIEITEACDVTFTCEMRPPMTALVAQAVKLLVGHWYANREAAGAALAETPMAVDMILSAIRWRKF